MAIDKVERIKMVKAMEFICRNLNDERLIESWLVDGVADGDIEYGDLGVRFEDSDQLYTYIDDDANFADLMDTFLFCLRYNKDRKGVLYCDGVVSKDASVN